jgi:excisionase family DNA binding protein
MREPASAAEPPFATLKQLAARYQVSTKTLLRLIRSGALKAHRLGGQWRISHEDARAFERLNRLG